MSNSSKSNVAITISFSFLALFMSGSTAGSPHLVEETTVRDMLMIDAEVALLHEQKRLREASGIEEKNKLPDQAAPNEPETKVIATPIPQVSLLGIFGIGNQLYADVSINSSRIRFQRGQHTPLGAGSDYQYRLKSINPPCITLMVNGEPLKKCLQE